MSSQTDGQYPTLDAIIPLSPIRRIERKGRKRGGTIGSWREVFMEKLAGVDLSGVFTIDDSASEQPAEDAAEAPVVLRTANGNRLIIETEEDFRAVISMIQHFSDVPEKLLESHLNLFIEPAPPGKVLNSAG